MAATAFLLCSSLAVAAGACTRADRETVRDSAAGVVDSVPATTATAVAAILSDENVFALLDTAYALIIETDRVGQQNASNDGVREFAGRAISQNALARSGIKATADRLQIAPVLPDRDVVKDHNDAMAALRTKTGAEFDKAFVDRAVETRKKLIDEIDDATERRAGTQQEAVRKFLGELRANLEADLKAAENLKAKLG